MKVHRGTPPNDANGIIAEGENGWTIYRRAASVEPWVSLKIAHLGPCEGAANYWLGWHAGEMRLANGRDTARMQTYHPDILEWVQSAMTELYPRLTEADMAL